VLGVTVLDALCAQALSESEPEDERSVNLTRSMTVNRNPEEVYTFWHDFENLPKFMTHLESVRMSGEGRSHWRAKGPAGRIVSWDAQTIEDRVNERISWRSLDGSDVQNQGAVHFERAPGGRGTVVRVEIAYAPPGGAVGASLANLFRGSLKREIDEDLRRFKQVMETGEVVRSDASIHRGTHAAQPVEVEDARSEGAAGVEAWQLTH
jgi:uncharacterized membrane protein